MKVWREEKEVVRLRSGNIVLVTRFFNRNGEQVDWKVVLLKRATKEA